MGLVGSAEVVLSCRDRSVRSDYQLLHVRRKVTVLQRVMVGVDVRLRPSRASQYRRQIPFALIKQGDAELQWKSWPLP